MAVIEYRAAAPRTTAERPIRIFLNDAPVAVSQGSPYDLAELAVGYLLSEGLIADRERFVEVTADPEASSASAARAATPASACTAAAWATAARAASCSCART